MDDHVRLEFYPATIRKPPRKFSFFLHYCHPFQCEVKQSCIVRFTCLSKRGEKSTGLRLRFPCLNQCGPRRTPAREIEVRAAGVVPNKTDVLIYMPDSNKFHEKALDGVCEDRPNVIPPSPKLPFHRRVPKITGGGSHSSEGSHA